MVSFLLAQRVGIPVKVCCPQPYMRRRSFTSSCFDQTASDGAQPLDRLVVSALRGRENKLGNDLARSPTPPVAACQTRCFRTLNMQEAFRCSPTKLQFTDIWYGKEPVGLGGNRLDVTHQEAIH